MKYVFITMRADNQGEGGSFALVAYIRRQALQAKILGAIWPAALLATALFYGDAVITPATSVVPATASTGGSHCSVGTSDTSKLNHRILHASRQSILTVHVNCRLVFVGENHGGDCRRRWTAMIPDGELTEFTIAGCSDGETCWNCLPAPDLAVQLCCFRAATSRRRHPHGAMYELAADAV